MQNEKMSPFGALIAMKIIFEIRKKHVLELLVDNHIIIILCEQVLIKII